MEKMVIEGGHALHGNVRVNGAKNASLPILSACLLAKGTSRIKNVPCLTDVDTLCKILNELGVVTERCPDGTLEITVREEKNVTAPYDLVRTMRASICVLGPLLGKRGKAEVSIPGGCAIGPRPIDIHIKGIESLGARVKTEGGYIIATAKKLKGTTTYLGGANGPTVLGTCTVMMAAVLGEGRTIIENAACEPEVQDLAHFLNKAGAKIRGIGDNTIIIEGVDELNGIDYEIIPDRIEAGTFMVAGAITGGNIVLENIIPHHLASVIDILRETGVDIKVGNDSGETSNGTDISRCEVRSNGDFRPANITTLPYPGIPTDMQAQLMAMLCVASGVSVINEKVFPHRYMHVAELIRMGADIKNEDAIAIVSGVPSLSGTTVMASDLRASASLVLAGLVAKGTTQVRRLYHIDRGYEKLEDRLSGLGARIWREKE